MISRMGVRTRKVNLRTIVVLQCLWSYFDNATIIGVAVRVPDDTEHRVSSGSVVLVEVDGMVITIIMEWY